MADTEPTGNYRWLSVQIPTPDSMEGVEATCACGGTERPTLPMPIDEFTKWCESVMEKHEQCRPKEAR